MCFVLLGVVGVRSFWNVLLGFNDWAIWSCFLGREAIMLGFKKKINTVGANTLENVILYFVKFLIHLLHLEIKKY